MKTTPSRASRSIVSQDAAVAERVQPDPGVRFGTPFPAPASLTENLPLLAGPLETPPPGLRILDQNSKELDVTFTQRWLVGVAVVGAAAGAAAVTLFWLVLTRPVALVAMLDGVR